MESETDEWSFRQFFVDHMAIYTKICYKNPAKLEMNDLSVFEHSCMKYNSIKFLKEDWINLWWHQKWVLFDFDQEKII